MAIPTTSSYGSSDDAPSHERLIPFPARRRDGERSPTRRSGARRPRRRRHQSSWLQRNALSIAAMSFLVALLGLGFGVVQLITRPGDATPAFVAVASPEQGTTMVAASVANQPAVPLGTTSVFAPQVREIRSAARVIEPTYTVESGDTLGKIATRFNTSVERIQAFNSQVTDPRALKIGTKLVIPPPL